MTQIVFLSYYAPGRAFFLLSWKGHLPNIPLGMNYVSIDLHTLVLTTDFRRSLKATSQLKEQRTI